MHVTIAFSGAAGTGVNAAGLFLGEILANHGYTIRADKEYASIIKGGNNSFFLSISDQGEVKLSKKIDLFIAFDEYAISKNQEVYDLQQIVNLKGQSARYINTFACGVCLRMTNISLDEGKEIIEKYIKKEYREQNFADLQNGFAYGSELCGTGCTTIHFSQKIAPPKKLMFGNELLGS